MTMYFGYNAPYVDESKAVIYETDRVEQSDAGVIQRGLIASGVPVVYVIVTDRVTVKTVEGMTSVKTAGLIEASKLIGRSG